MPKPAEIIRYTTRFVLRWTVGALLFGSILEAMLSLGQRSYRLEVPLLMALAVFALSLSGSVLALCLV